MTYGEMKVHFRACLTLAVKRH